MSSYRAKSPSTGAKLALQASVKDSTGRLWINNKYYQSSADTGSCKTEAAPRARDPFQNVYSEVANEMLAAREALVPRSRRDIRRVTRLELARDLAPAAMDGYLERDPQGLVKIARPPAADGIGGAASILSALKKYSEARTHAQD